MSRKSFSERAVIPNNPSAGRTLALPIVALLVLLCFRHSVEAGFFQSNGSVTLEKRIEETLERHPIRYTNALFAAMQSESAVLGFPGDGLFTVHAEAVNAGETGYAVYLTVSPGGERPGAEAVQYHFGSAEQKGGEDRAGKLGDLFILGDFRKPYYVNKRSLADSDTGFVYIFHFDPAHAVVRLHGRPEDYVLVGMGKLPQDSAARGFKARMLGRIGGGSPDKGGTAIVRRETEDVIGVLVGVGPERLAGGLSGRNFEYDRPPEPTRVFADGVQVPNEGLLGGGRYVAAAENGDFYLAGSSKDGFVGVPGDGVLYVGRFRPDGTPVWQRRIGGTRTAAGQPVVGDTPADLLAVDGRLYLATIRRALGAADGIAGRTNAARVYAVDGRDGMVEGVYTPEFGAGEGAEKSWSAAAGIASDGAGHVYVSGERSSGRSATPFLLKLRASDLREVWRMGPYDGYRDETAELETKATGLKARMLKRLLKRRRGGDEGGGGGLLKEAWGGVAFWTGPAGVRGAGIAYLSGYRWGGGSGESPLTAWIAAVSETGELLWLREIGGNGYEWPWATAVDAGGNVYFGGITTSDRGLHTLGSPPGGAGDGFIAKYDRDGNRIWTRLMTGTDGQEVRDLVFHDGALYALGHTFGPFPETGIRFGPGGRSDLWVARLDPGDGRIRAALRFGTPRHERASLAIQNDRLFVGGKTFGSMGDTKKTSGLDLFSAALELELLR